MHYYQENRNNKVLAGPARIAVHVLRLAFAAVFLFSGFVKAIDPLGFQYKLEDYFHAFGLNLSFVSIFALIFAILLSSMELIIGAMLVFQIQMKKVVPVAWIYMLAMTVLTFYIAKTDPVTDCGCFGDALVITNWQTFTKNIVLFSFISVVWTVVSQFKNIFLPKAEFTLIVLFVFISAGISLNSLRHLPVLDFRPYSVGTYIPEKMNVPDGAPLDIFVTKFIYEKDGVQKEFDITNYPQNDSSWIFVDQQTELVSKGFQPEIHDLEMINTDFEDISEEVLNFKAYTYLLVMYDLSKSNDRGVQEGLDFLAKYNKTNVKVYALTSSSDQDVEQFHMKYNTDLDFLKVDPITLKTMIRANPGLILLHNGRILGKWNWRDIN